MAGTTYGYHYGGPGGRSDRYRNVTSKASGLQVRHSNKTEQTSSMQFKSKYDKLDATTKSALDKFTNKPDSQLTSAERDSLYRIEPWFYLQYVRSNYPNKVEFHKDRLKSFTGFKRNMEDNGLVPKESSETQAAKQMVENAEAPAEQAKSEKPSKGATADAWFAGMLSPDKLAAEKAAFEKQKAIEKQEAQDVQAAIERQAAQDMVDNSRSNPLDLSFNEKVYRPWAEEYGKRARPNSKTVISKREDLPSNQSLTPHVDFTWRENSDNLPFYNKNAVNRHIPDATHAPEFYLNPVEPLAAPYEYGPIVTRKAAEKAYDQKLDRKIAIENAIKDGLWGLGILGATAGTFYGLDRLGKYIRQDDSDERPQTQVPYRIEPEPVNEAVVQPEPTLEQQYAAQDIPSLSTKIDNLFDLYQQQEQLMREKEIAASQAYQNALDMGQRIATGTGYAPELKEENFEFPQNPPEVGSNIKTAGLKSPNGGKVPQELNGLSGVKPRVIKDTSNGPVVLNDPNHRKTRDVQNNSVTPEQAVAKKMVNQYAGIPVEVAKAKNSGYTPPFLTTDAIWDRVRKAGLSSPEQAIRSGLFTPTEVRYITENDLWRYR